MESTHLISSRQITLTVHYRTHGTLLLLLTVAKHSRNTSSPGAVSIAVRHWSMIIMHCHNATMKHELGGGMLVQHDAVPMSQLFLDVDAHGGSGYSLDAFP